MEESSLFQTELDLICAGYDTAYFSREDVLFWADSWIERLDDPPIVLIDISMAFSEDSRKIQFPFNEVFRSIYSDAVTEYFIGFLGLMWNELDLDSTYSVVNAMSEKGAYHHVDDELNSEILTFDYLQEYVEEGWCSHEEFILRLKQFLAPYVDSVSKQLEQLPACLQSNSL